MLRTYLHRRGQIPAAVHPFEKATMAGQTQPKKETCWVYHFVSIFYFIPIAMLQSLQRQFRRNS